MPSAATTTVLPAGADPFGTLTSTTVLPDGLPPQVATAQTVTAETITVLPGPPGPSGSATVTATAAVALSGHRVVYPLLDGTATYASNTTLADATRDVWLTLGAAVAGTQVQAQLFGIVTEPSWQWVEGPIFLDVNGQLTQIPPTAATGAAFIRQVAHSVSPTSLFFNPRTPIGL